MNEPARRRMSFEQARLWTGIVLAPVVFFSLWFLPIAGLDQSAHRLLAILGLVVTLWVTEVLPLAVTALLGPALCVMAGIGPAKEVLQNFADPIIFLFIGSFILAEGMFHHGLNRRIAFGILSLRAVGESPARLMIAFGCITGFLSMWVSNTTTTAMMMPIALAILSEMARRRSLQTGTEISHTSLRFGVGLMLITAFASGIGGLATPVGTAPNLIGIGMIRENIGVEIPFFKWMAFGLPITLLLLLFLLIYLNRVCPAEPGLLGGSAGWIRHEREKLGSLSPGERNVLLAFGLTVFFWLLPGALAIVSGTETEIYKWFTTRLPEPLVALFGATLLFVLPVDLRAGKFTITWNEAKRIEWGTVLLFGGGLAMGDLMFSTGLAEWIGRGLAETTNAQSTLALIVLFTIISAAVTECASNTASASMVVPVAIAVAQAADVNPLQPALAACLGASVGCMLPVSTPPNAIVYGSGCVPLSQMVRHGLAVNLLGVTIIILVVWQLAPLLFS